MLGVPGPRLWGKGGAISGSECAVRSKPAGPDRWCSSGPTSRRSVPGMPLRLSTSLGAMTSYSVLPAMAAFGSSAPVTRGDCRHCSSGCGGRVPMLSRTPSPACLGGSRSGMPTGWKTSTTRTPIVGSCRAAASESALEMFLQPRHQLDEVARAEAVVELVDEDAFPGVAAGARGAGQSEQIGAAGDSRGRAALDRRGPDLVVAEPAEELAETGDLLLVDAVKSLRRDVAPGDAGAAGRDHDIDVGIGDPILELGDDLVLLVAHYPPRGDAMAGRRREVGEPISGTVLRRLAGV